MASWQVWKAAMNSLVWIFAVQERQNFQNGKITAKLQGFSQVADLMLISWFLAKLLNKSANGSKMALFAQM